jgi:aryl-alcohol dehydrogenase-like predicted oxidoreductase
VEAQSCDDEFDHATCVVAGVAVRADTEIADATQQFVGIRFGANLARRGSGVEQLGAHGDKAVEEIGVQGLEGGIVGLQRLGEAVLGDQEVGEEVNPPGQGGVRCAAVRQQGRTGLTELDNSLRRLGAGHVDLYQIHRWDPGTSDEETLAALTDLQRGGKIRYFGSSTFPAYRIVQAEWAARENHLSHYVTEQPSYSILQRGIETHVLPVTEQYGLGVLVWSPLASGWLSGAIREGREITTSRSAFMPPRFNTALPSNRARLDAVEQLATVGDKAGLTMIQLALGFVTAHPAVTSAIIGPRTMDHLHSQLAAADTVLSADAIVAPGTDLAAHEKYDTPPALLDAAQRRR